MRFQNFSDPLDKLSLPEGTKNGIDARVKSQAGDREPKADHKQNLSVMTAVAFNRIMDVLFRHKRDD